METRYNWVLLVRVVLIAAMGGLLFGYDWVVIGGAKAFYEAYFGLDDPFRIGWAINSAVVGCMLGALVSGALSDKFGRKYLLVLAGALFLVSALGSGLTDSFRGLLLYRLIGGAGMGLASALSPVYIAEITPAAVRGRFVSTNQLAIVVGVVAAQVANWLIAEPVAEGVDLVETWNGQNAWRWMFWAESVPAVLFAVLMLTVPESPRWLVKNGRKDRAHLILGRVGGRAHADFEVRDIEATLENEIQRVDFRDLLAPGVFKIVLVGAFLAVFQQWCGINVVFQFAEEVFTDAGFDLNAMLFNVVLIGGVMLISTVIAILTVDRLGRRTLMLFGSAGLAVSYVLLGYGYHTGRTGLFMLALIVAAVAVYSVTLAPIVWVLLSEIFPNRIRGAAMAVGVFALWFGNGTLTLSFPYLRDALNIASTFWLYAAICVVGFVVVFRYVPETKQKSLEEFEREIVG